MTRTHRLRPSLPCLLGGGLLAVLSPASHAWYNCDVKRSISKEMDASTVSQIEILAVAGDLHVKGDSGAGLLTAEGRACTSSRYEDRIGEFDIIEERDGNTLRIVAAVPRKGIGDSLVGELDLTITLPSTLPVRIVDTSGDIDVRNTGELTLKDSSGDITLKDINGDVNVGRDSSGDLRIRQAGNVTIDIDSSGDIVARDILSLTVGKDSSGDIRAEDVTGDVRVGKDSSGDIAAINVGGNLEVIDDGSGDIIMRNVGGSVSIPRNKRDD